jgi:hypothetical protein
MRTSDGLAAAENTVCRKPPGRGIYIPKTSHMARISGNSSPPGPQQYGGTAHTLSPAKKKMSHVESIEAVWFAGYHEASAGRQETQTHCEYVAVEFGLAWQHSMRHGITCGTTLESQ